MRKRLLARFAGRGTLVQPKALELLLEQPDPEGSAELVLSGVPEDRLIITAEDVRRALDGVRGTDGPPERPGQTEPLAAGPPGPPASQPPSPSVLEPQSPVAPEPVKPSTAQSVRTIPTSAKGLRVLKDVTGRSTCEGHLEDFVRYFNDRMARLKRMLRNRRELIGAVPVGAIKARRHDREVRTIAMVTEVRRTPNGRIIADIEDETGSFRILLPAEDRPPVNLMRDEVIGIVGKLSNEGDIIWVQNVVRPDLPLSR